MEADGASVQEIAQRKALLRPPQVHLCFLILFMDARLLVSWRGWTSILWGGRGGETCPLASLLYSSRCARGTSIIKDHVLDLELRLVRKGFRGAWLEF